VNEGIAFLKHFSSLCLKKPGSLRAKIKSRPGLRFFTLAFTRAFSRGGFVKRVLSGLAPARIGLFSRATRGVSIAPSSLIKSGRREISTISAPGSSKDIRNKKRVS
jgi:hypothetical protein